MIWINKEETKEEKNTDDKKISENGQNEGNDKKNKNDKKEYKDPKNVKEIGGPKGPEPTRYGDWEKGGRVTDFWDIIWYHPCTEMHWWRSALIT